MARVVRTTRALIALLEEAQGEFIQQLTVNVHAELAENTPRDTGWAAASWVPSIGQPFEVDLDDDLDRPARFAEIPGSVAAVNAGLSELEKVKITDQVFITNNVPYIIDLNAGSSRKAPANFVQIAIATGIASLDGVEKK